MRFVADTFIMFRFPIDVAKQNKWRYQFQNLKVGNIFPCIVDLSAFVIIYIYIQMHLNLNGAFLQQCTQNLYIFPKQIVLLIRPKN
jgi:hypothetical protein